MVERAGPGDGKDPVHAVNRGVNGVLAGLASVSLLSMMVLIVGNMFMRTFAAPFPGAFEVVGWLAAITSALALGYTQLHKGHVDIDVLTRLMPSRVQNILQLLVTLLSAAFFLLVAWRLYGMAGRLQAVGTLSESLRVPYFPFVYVVALGMLGLAVALVADAINNGRTLVADLSGRAAPSPGSGAREGRADGRGGHDEETPDGDR